MDEQRAGKQLHRYRSKLARLDGLATAAAAVRDGFEPDPGTSDLDDEQPIHLSITLGQWRRLNLALHSLDQ